ncbi:hypothetical protein [Desulfobaculum bizertense]|uniref:Uncharacterized protein n=1 Tax=Desulfobaculum bizertense DSM 18034 TaxID=1121442 RepID=A0A1T4VWH1_9BACT|nr:hypothetical protein [Desulfobaculum bizertense]SKA69148.1 hypothetical protein SAMN02745702_01044 [Desulfobaculum bizertense DSM 18034]
MSQATQISSPALKALVETTEKAKELAREEIKALRKDLLFLERQLNSKKTPPPDEVPLHDIVHGAMEIFKAGSLAMENERMLAGMKDAVERSLSEDFLLGNGATLLKEPAGWHWISPKGVMHFLGSGEEPQKAVAKLKRHLPRKPKAQPGAEEAEAPATQDA